MASIQRGKSLYEQTYQALRTSILSGELAPGERLIETQLAEQLQVSRTPVREAIRQLQQDALISVDRAGNLRVVTVSATDAAQLYDCRLCLEQHAARVACEQATDAQLQQLEEWVLRSEALVDRLGIHQQGLSTLVVPMPLGFYQDMLELDYRFHRQIAENSGNLYLLSLLEQIFSQMALLRAQTTRHNLRVLDICDEHRQLFTALADRNLTATLTAVEAHLTASKNRVLQELQT